MMLYFYGDGVVEAIVFHGVITDELGMMANRANKNGQRTTMQDGKIHLAGGGVAEKDDWIVEKDGKLQAMTAAEFVEAGYADRDPYEAEAD